MQFPKDIYLEYIIVYFVLSDIYLKKYLWYARLVRKNRRKIIQKSICKVTWKIIWKNETLAEATGT